MARFIHWSDLHIELDYKAKKPFELPDLPSDVDALLLAGDTAVGDGHLDFLQKAWEKYEIPVISVWGNHESYHHNYTELRAREAERLADLQKSGADIRVLFGEATEVAGTVVIGTPLWTNFSLYPGMEFQAKKLAAREMNDFENIRIGDKGRFLTPNDMEALYNEEKAKLSDLLKANRDRTTVVMTHYLPSETCVAPAFRGDLLTASFATNLNMLIDRYDPDFWVYGHTHSGREVDINTSNGVCRFRHNPRGYPWEPTMFEPDRIIDTNDRRVKTPAL